MKYLIKITSFCSAILLLYSFNVSSQAISGTVLSLSGTPIVDADVKLVSANKTTKTDINGYYDFENSGIQHVVDRLNYSLTLRNNRLYIHLEKTEYVSIDIYNLSGRLISRCRLIISLGSRHF